MPLLLALLQTLSGDGVIRGRAGGSEIVIRSTTRVAGAIDSLTWGGKDFIDSADHGRQLQSASNGDLGVELADETYNPTEAGSRADGAGASSTSVLLAFKAAGRVLETRTRMAFWLRPGDRSGGVLAKNPGPLSDQILSKRVTIGVEGLPNVVESVVTFTIPVGERHTRLVFESLTGYMPWDFQRFLVLDPQRKVAEPAPPGIGEQPRPLIFATESGSHAMGIWSPAAPAPGYGRFRFEAEKVVKWNCVFRVRDVAGIPPGDFTFRHFVVVGTLDDVVASMSKLVGK